MTSVDMTDRCICLGYCLLESVVVRTISVKFEISSSTTVPYQINTLLFLHFVSERSQSC